MKFLKKMFLLFVIIGLIILFYFVFNGYMLYRRAIDTKSIEARVTELRSKDFFTTYNELPSYYIDAVVAVEDHRFYTHNGIDYLSILRAVLNNIKAGKPVEGGSSITQQVAKNLVFNQEKTIYRKIAELFAARDLERHYSKNEILELYVNNMYFGNGYYNIHDACYGYYKKVPKELTLYEATLLAGVPNAPSVYAPTVNMKLAEQRQSQVLDKMVEYKKISEEEANKIKSMQQTK